MNWPLKKGVNVGFKAVAQSKLNMPNGGNSL
jgi:hypothetical protein